MPPARSTDPDVVGVGERDVRCADRRRPQQSRRPAVGRGPPGECHHDEGTRGAHREHPGTFLHTILPKAGDGTIFRHHETTARRASRSCCVLAYAGAMVWLVTQETRAGVRAAAGRWAICGRRCRSSRSGSTPSRGRQPARRARCAWVHTARRSARDTPVGHLPARQRRQHRDADEHPALRAAAPARAQRDRAGVSGVTAGCRACRREAGLAR